MTEYTFFLHLGINTTTMLSYTILLNNCRKGTVNCARILRKAHKWNPDAEWCEQFKGPLMYPCDETANLKAGPWNGILPPKEFKVKNMQINFGPQHPAAHGVLRLLLELDGEVSSVSFLAFLFSFECTE